MKTDTIPYQCGVTHSEGFVAYDEDISGKRPCIIIAPAWRGLDDFAKEKAQQLAELGYVGFVADIYGDGKHVGTNEEAASLMMPLFLDRKMLRDRISSAYDAAANFSMTDKSRIGAIGFCFGGLTVIELLRNGEDLKGVVSFHGLLGYTLNEMEAEPAPNADELHGSLLILHGNEDPMVSLDDIVSIQDEMTDAEVDWQMHIYGNTMHAFTNPVAEEPEQGMQHNPIAEKRAWQSMRNFFEEVL